MKEIHCRLWALIRQKGITAQSLAAKTDIRLRRIEQYCDDTLSTIDLAEVSRLLDALECDSLAELFEVKNTGNKPVSQSGEASDEWHSPCPTSDTGRHDWFRDANASNAIYQEYECRVCGQRIHMIW